MIYPSREEYRNYADTYNLVPICKELRVDFETPLSLFLKLEGKFLLESVEQGANVGRYSIIGKGIKTEFHLTGKTLRIRGFKNGKVLDTITQKLDNPLVGVREYLKKYKVAEREGLPPFYGGLIGYLGYEAIQYFEKVPVKSSSDDIPDGLLIIPEVVCVFDTVKRTVIIIISSEPRGNPYEAYDKSIDELNLLCDKLSIPVKMDSTMPQSTTMEIKYCVEKPDFINSIKKCKEYIYEGEIIQAVLSQRIEILTDADPFMLYRTLRVLNPSPYMFYLDFDDFKIVGSSPEVMVRVQNNEILLKPIAGTRKRGKTIEEDSMISAELLADPKERAEHVMLVDLGRNDLGRVARAGSVDVVDYMAIEKYSHVMHIVSTIKAKLGECYDVFDVIRSTFPAGTLSGAPKIRAMEIIHELEPLKRGTYGGMILNLGFNMNLDSCITIRTLIIKDKIARIQAGAGIVADSDPEKEYSETLDKAMALIKTIEETIKGSQI